MRRRFIAIVIALDVTALVAGCASGSTGHDPVPTWSVASPRVLTAPELRQFSSALTLYDAMLISRVNILSTRFADALVYVDGHLYGDKSTLRQIPVGTVREVRLLTASEATMRYGSLRRRGSAIDVSTIAFRR